MLLIFAINGTPYVSDIDFVKTCLFNVKLKLLINFNFSQFHEYVFRSSRTQVLFKIDALKNFSVLKIKKRLQRRYFPVRSSHYEVFLKPGLFFLQANVNILIVSFSKCWDSDFMS